MKFGPKQIVGGRWKVFRERVEGQHYVLSVDAASGKEGSNESVANVLGIESGVQCAILAGQIHPVEMAVEAEKAGLYYNEAEIAVEKELHGATIIEKLRDTYPHLFVHEETLVGFGETVIKQYGWEPRSYRQTAIDWLQQAIGFASSTKPEERKQAVWLLDPATIEQHSYFTQNRKTGKWEAASGKKDDRVSALYIGQFVRRLRYMNYVNKVVEKPKERTFEDILAMSSRDEDEDRSMDFEV